MYLDPIVPLEFGYISEPLFIRSICMELTVQNILGYVLRILGTFSAALVSVLDPREHLSLPAYPQHPLVGDYYAMVTLQLVSQPSVTHIRMLFIDFGRFLGYLSVLSQSLTRLSCQPCIVSRPGYLQNPAPKFNRYLFLLCCQMNRTVFPVMPYL